MPFTTFHTHTQISFTTFHTHTHTNILHHLPHTQMSFITFHTQMFFTTFHTHTHTHTQNVLHPSTQNSKHPFPDKAPTTPPRQNGQSDWPGPRPSWSWYTCWWCRSRNTWCSLWGFRHSGGTSHRGTGHSGNPARYSETQIGVVNRCYELSGYCLHWQNTACYSETQLGVVNRCYELSGYCLHWILLTLHVTLKDNSGVVNRCYELSMYWSHWQPPQHVTPKHTSEL